MKLQFSDKADNSEFQCIYLDTTRIAILTREFRNIINEEQVTLYAIKIRGLKLAQTSVQRLLSQAEDPATAQPHLSEIVDMERYIGYKIR